MNDGTQPENQLYLSEPQLRIPAWAPNAVLWLIWSGQTLGSAQDVAIDDLAFTARGPARVVQESMVSAPTFAAIAIDVENIDDHRQRDLLVDSGVSLASYRGTLPDYVMGTDFKRSMTWPGERAAVSAPRTR